MISHGRGSSGVVGPLIPGESLALPRLCPTAQGGSSPPAPRGWQGRGGPAEQSALHRYNWKFHRAGMKTKPGPRAAPAKAPSQGSGSNQVLGRWVLIDPNKVCTWWEGHGPLCHHCHHWGPYQGPLAHPQHPSTRIWKCCRSRGHGCAGSPAPALGAAVLGMRSCSPISLALRDSHPWMPVVSPIPASFLASPIPSPKQGTFLYEVIWSISQLGVRGSSVRVVPKTLGTGGGKGVPCLTALPDLRSPLCPSPPPCFPPCPLPASRPFFLFHAGF